VASNESRDKDPPVEVISDIPCDEGGSQGTDLGASTAILNELRDENQKLQAEISRQRQSMKSQEHQIIQQEMIVRGFEEQIAQQDRALKAQHALVEQQKTEMSSKEIDIRGCQTKLSEMKVENNFLSEKISLVRQSCNVQNSWPATRAEYWIKLLIIQYLEKEGKDSVSQILQISAGILPSTRLHRDNEKQLADFLEQRQFHAARQHVRYESNLNYLKVIWIRISLHRDVFKAVELSGIRKERDLMLRCLEQLEFVLDRFYFIWLVQIGKLEESYVLLNSRIYGYLQKFRSLSESMVGAEHPFLTADSMEEGK
jgi:hypothetical protein